MKKNTVTSKQISELIDRSEVSVSTVHDKVTIVCLKLPNGFVITESSACVDPANYDEKVGRDICMERITNKLWEQARSRKTRADRQSTNRHRVRDLMG